MKMEVGTELYQVFILLSTDRGAGEGGEDCGGEYKGSEVETGKGKKS